MPLNALAFTQPANQHPTGNLSMNANGTTYNPAPTVAVTPTPADYHGNNPASHGFGIPIVPGISNIPAVPTSNIPSTNISSGRPPIGPAVSSYIKKNSVNGPSPFSTVGGAILPNEGMPKLPTSVVSSATAKKKVSNIASTIKNQNNFQNQNQPPKITTNMDGSQSVHYADGHVINIPKPVAPVAPPPEPPKTVEDHLADQTLHPGQVQMFNQRTGAQEWVAPGTPGYGTQNPSTRTDVSNTADVGNGIQYKQFSDGTFGRFDSAGNFSPATAQAFQDAKNQESINTKIQSILNGTFVLPANQQTQLNGISSKYADLIAKQETENANITGAQTIAQNLYGMGNTMIGKGEITKTVNDGIQRVATLQQQLATTLATMTDAFQKDDIALLKDSYDSYQSSQRDIQNEIDKTEAYLQAQQDKEDVKKQTFALQQMNRYGDAGIEVDDTPAQIQAKKQANSAIYANEVKTKGGIVDETALQGMLDIYKKTGQIPTFGIGGASTKLAFYKAIGGHPENVDEATANKAAIAGMTKALGTQQNQYAANQTAINTLTSQLSLAGKYSDLVDRTDSPLLAKYALWLKGKGAGDANTAALNNIVKTAAYEFAKILSGSAASIQGVTVSSAADAEDMLNSAMSKGQFRSVLALMKQEANFRLTSQQGTINQLRSDLNTIGTNSNGSSNTSSSSGSSASSGWAGY